MEYFVHQNLNGLLINTEKKDDDEKVEFSKPWF